MNDPTLSFYLLGQMSPSHEVANPVSNGRCLGGKTDGIFLEFHESLHIFYFGKK